MNLRDYDLSIWSKPTKSSKLDAQFQAKRNTVKAARAPDIHSRHEVLAKSQAAEEDKRLTALCQKEPPTRSREEVAFIRAFTASLCPFFNLWPEALQTELARVLSTEVLVRGESVVTRGAAPTKLCMVLSGQLAVVVPQPARPEDFPRQPALAATSPRRAGDGAMDGAGSEGRVMAILKRGDSCGEAALLGHAMSHASVVVSSPGAVCLSLSFSDFLRAFKEIMGLRQQDRLIYLRMHPLMAGVSLGDLDMLADALHMSYYPPGTKILPCRKGEGRRLYLIAEGSAAVRRTHHHHQQQHRARQHADMDDGHGPLAYDSDTVSVLQALDVFGSSHLPHGFEVEAVSSIKAYWLSDTDLAAMPGCIQGLLEDAQLFKGAYFEGRLEGLAVLDISRRRPTYGAYSYKVGDVTLMSLGLASPGRLPSSRSQAQPGVTHSPSSHRTWTTTSHGPSRGHAAGGNAKGQEHLDALAAMDVLAVLDARAAIVPDKFMGLPPASPSRVGQHDSHKQLAGGRLGPTQRSNVSSKLAHSRELTGADSPTQLFITQVDDSSEGVGHAQGTQPKGVGPSLDDFELSQSVHWGMGGAQKPATQRPRSPPKERPSHKQHSATKGSARLSSRNPPAQPAFVPEGSCVLGRLPPDVMAWPQIEVGRRQVADTEVPGPQRVPVTLRERHTAIFGAARRAAASGRPPTRDTYAYGDDSDDEGAAGSGKLAEQGARQPSRRLSANRSRGSREGRLASQAQAQNQQRLWTQVQAQAAQQSPQDMYCGDAASQYALMQQQLETARASSSSSTTSLNPPPWSPMLAIPLVQQPQQQHAAASGLSAESGAYFDAFNSVEVPPDRVGMQPLRRVSQSELQPGSDGQLPPSGADQGSMYIVAMHGSASNSQSASQQDGSLSPRNQQPVSPGRMSKASQQLSQEHAAQDLVMPLDGHVGMRTHRRSAMSGVLSDAGSAQRQPHLLDQQLLADQASHQQQFQARGGDGHSPPASLLADTTVGSIGGGAHGPLKLAPLQIAQPSHSQPALQPQQAAQQYRGVSLPPSVVLGYESLDPLSWASVMSYAPPAARAQQTQGSQEKVLPAPKWF